MPPFDATGLQSRIADDEDSIFNPWRDRADPKFHPSAEDFAAGDDICETVFRYQFEHNESAIQKAAGYYFLSLTGSERDPSPGLLARFRGHTPAVAPVSSSVSSVHGVMHAKNGRRGLIFRVTKIKWLSTTLVHVDGGYFEAGLSSSQNVFRVRLRNGKWEVTDDHRWFIS